MICLVCCVFTPCSTAEIQTWGRKDLSQTLGLPLVSERLDVYVLGKAKTET